MTESIYTERQLQILRGEIPEEEIITAEYTRMLKYAAEAGDDDVIAIIKPLREERAKKRIRHNNQHVAKYANNHYDRIQCFFPKGYKDLLKDYAAEYGTSVNNLILTAVKDKFGDLAPKTSDRRI